MRRDGSIGTAARRPAVEVDIGSDVSDYSFGSAGLNCDGSVQSDGDANGQSGDGSIDSDGDSIVASGDDNQGSGYIRGDGSALASTDRSMAPTDGSGHGARAEAQAAAKAAVLKLCDIFEQRGCTRGGAGGGKDRGDPDVETQVPRTHGRPPW